MLFRNAFLSLLTFQTLWGADTPEKKSPSIPYRWSNVAMGGAGFVSGIIPHPGEKGLMYARTDVGGIYRFNGGNGSWDPLLDWLPPDRTSAMGVEALALDPNDASKVYILTGTSYWPGGTCILRSSDRGRTWQSTDVSEKIRAHGNGRGRHTGERLAVDPGLGSILFCGSRNNGLWKSVDSGVTWSRAAFSPGPEIPRASSKEALSHPATTNDGNGICFVIFDPADSKRGEATRRLFVGLSRPRIERYQDKEGAERTTPEGNIFESVDGGETWRPLPPLPKLEDARFSPDLTFQPSRALADGGSLFVTFQSDKPYGGGFFRYDIASGKWADLTPGAPDGKGGWKRHYHSYSGVDIVAADPPRMMLTTFGLYQPQKDVEGKQLWGERVYYSTRGPAEDGKGWLDLFGTDKARIDPNIPFARGQNIHWGASVVMDRSHPQRAFITAGNGIWGTTTLLDSLAPEKERRSLWKLAVKGLEESVPMDVASIPDGPLISVIWDYAGFTNKDPARYSEHGQFRVCAGLNVRLASTGRGANAGVLRLNAEGELAWSLDSGITWTELEKTGLGKAGTDTAIALSADAKVILYSPQDRKVYRNEDPSRKWPAEGWREVADLADANRPVADPLDGRCFYAYRRKSGELLRSTDNGKTFPVLSKIGAWGSQAIRIAPGRKEDIWIPWQDGGLARFVNGSVTRIPLAHCSTVGFGRGKYPGDYPTIFIWGKPLPADPTGIYRSTDEGKNWARVNDDLHQYGGLANGGFVKGDMNVFGRVYMSTAGRGIPFGTPAD